jgi:serine phosphatase RsbU (regulator of sigma subunit)
MMTMEEKKLLLLVDDDPVNIQVVHSILKDDYKIRVATSGAKALDLAKTEPKPDLILLDVMMPEMDGYQVCGHLKAAHETRDIPVIFLTGKTEVVDETRGFEAGAVDYIHKPFSPPIVKARVWTHLLLRESREQLARQLSAINSEIELAREIQMSILPRQTPKFDGLHIAACFIPMSSVGGDFYDFVIADPQHIGVLIADVTGHGLPAALIASMLKVALSAQAAHAADPARVLSGLNQTLCGMFRQYYVTAAYIFVDMEKRILSYAGAGHPPLLLWSESTGSARELQQNGLLLGLFPTETYSAVQVPIQGGDRIVLYTDGIIEATNTSDEEFGIDRFKQFLETEKGLGADKFVEALLGKLSRWSANPATHTQQDDITLLTIDFKRPLNN